jgi:hypothetical protein
MKAPAAPPCVVLSAVREHLTGVLRGSPLGRLENLSGA